MYCYILILQVLKETLRRHPTATGTLRRTNKEMEIGGYKIPANVSVMVHISSLFRLKRARLTKPIMKRGSVHCDWFILPLLLLTPTIWFSLDRERRSHKRNRKKMHGNVLILSTPILSHAIFNVSTSRPWSEISLYSDLTFG